MPAQVDRRLLDERNLQREHVVLAVLVDALRVRCREPRGGIRSAVDRIRHPHEHLLAHNLAVEQRHVENRDPGKGLLHLELVAMVDALPLLKQLVVQLAGQQPVDHDSVGHVAEKAQVGVRPLGLFDDHLLEVQDDADGRHLRVGQHLAHAVEVEQKVLQRRVDLIRRQRHVHHRLKHGPGNAHRAPRPRIDLVEPPLGDVGEGEQLERLSGRSAVDDQHVVLRPLRVVLDPHQGGDFIHSRRVCDLVREDFVQPLGGKHLDRILVELRPVPLHLVQRRDLVRPEVVGHLHRLSAELDVERITQRVRGVGAHDDGPVTGGSAPHGGRGGDGCLAYPAFTGKQDDPHGRSLRTGRFSPLPRPDHLLHVLLDQRLDVAEDRQRQLRVSLGQLGYVFDRAQDLHVLAVGLVRLRSRVLERQAVFLRLAVARQKQHGPGVCGLRREDEIEHDERSGVPAVRPGDRVEDDPHEDNDRLADDVARRSEKARSLLREATERVVAKRTVMLSHYLRG